MLDQTRGDTLALVNVVREAFGYEALTELPDARTGATTDCLYYRALKDVGVTSVGGDTMSFSSERQAQTVAALWGTSANGTYVNAPKSIRSVIGAFDGRKVPHYNV